MAASKGLFRAAAQFARARRALHASAAAAELSPLRMPALSPTMESGTVSRWSIPPGTRFSAGDILLTVETDKAEVDVEAQDDGVMGPQVVAAGKGDVRVGEIIAVLGEDEGEVQGATVKEEWKQAAGGAGAPEAKAEPELERGGKRGAESAAEAERADAKAGGAVVGSRLPLSPAVSRLLQESGTSDLSPIRGTGLHGRLTKGDVLAYLGRASSPHGTAASMVAAYRHPADVEIEASRAKEVTRATPKAEPVDGPALRRMILSGLTAPRPAPRLVPQGPSFESVLQGYQVQMKATPPGVGTVEARPDAYAAILSR